MSCDQRNDVAVFECGLRRLPITVLFVLRHFLPSLGRISNPQQKMAAAKKSHARGCQFEGTPRRLLGPCLIPDCRDDLQQQMFRLVAIGLDLTQQPCSSGAWRGKLQIRFVMISSLARESSKGVIADFLCFVPYSNLTVERLRA